MIYYLFIWLKEKPTTQISMHPWGGYENQVGKPLQAIKSLHHWS